MTEPTRRTICRNCDIRYYDLSGQPLQECFACGQPVEELVEEQVAQ